MASNQNLELKVRITAQLTELQNGLADLNKKLEEFGKKGKAAGRDASQGIDSISGQLRSAGTLVKGLAAGFAALQAVQLFAGFVKQGIEFNKQLETSKLGIAALIAAQTNLQDAQGKTVDGQEAIAVATGLAEDQMQKLRIAGLQTAATTTQLVEAFQQAVGPGIAAGLNLDDIRTTTVQITQAASALGVPMNQISQEVRSILEGSIDINSRVAKALGITNEQVANWKAQNTLVAELNKRMAGFVAAGEKAGDTFEVIKSNAGEALQAFSGDVTQGFFDRIKEALKSATTGIFDTKKLGITDAFKDFAGLLREIISLIGDGVAGAITGTVSLVQDLSGFIHKNREAVEGVLNGFKLLASTIGSLLGMVAKLVLGVVDVGVKTKVWQTVLETISFIIAGFQDGLRVVGAAIVALGALIIKVLLDPVVGLLNLMAQAAGLVSAEAKKQLQDLGKSVDSVSKDAFEAAGQILQPITDGKGAVAEAIAKVNELNAAAKKAGEEQQKAAEKGPGGQITGAKFGQALGKKDDNELLKADLKRKLDTLERGYKLALTSTDAYYAERIALQTRSIDAEIAQQEVELGKLQKTDEKGRSKILTQIALLEQQKTDVVTKAGNDRFDFERQLQDKLDGLRARVLAGTGDTLGAKGIEIELEFKDLIARLEKDGNVGGLAIVRQLINVEEAKTRLDSVQTEIGKVLTGFGNAQQGIVNSIASGSLDHEGGQSAISAAADKTIGDLVRFRTELAALVDQGVPGAKEAFDQLNLSIASVGKTTQTGATAAMEGLRLELDALQKDFVASAANSGVDALTNLFTDLASGTKSAGEAVRDFVRGFAASMAQLAARVLATYAVLQLLSIATGIPVQTLALASGGVGAVTGKGQHTGGITGVNSSFSRRIPAIAFAGAPRYHAGGIVGLKPDEVPSILQRGEEVLSKSDPRNSMNGGGQQGDRGTRIINVIDPNLVQDYLNSSTGEKTLINMIQRNAGSIRQVLA